MADYSGLTKKELLHTLLARDLMLEERRKENDLQKATINTLIVDHKASKEWYKKQLEEKDEQINWLVEAEFNRKWAKKYVEMRRKEDPMLCLPDSDEVYERYFEQKEYIDKLEQNKISFALEQLKKVKECLYKIQSPIGEKPTLMDDGDVFEVINNQINQLKEMK